MELELLEMLDEKIQDVETIMSRYPCKMIKSGKVTRLNMAPNKLIFGGKEFIGSFVFEEEKLKHIFLIPIIKGVEIPNYPTEEYQKTKAEYCKSVLTSIYGDVNPQKDSSIWKTQYGEIVVYELNEGKDKYTGGNIRIDMR